MTNDFKVDSSTKLNDLLTAFPPLKQQLPAINERFKMLDTPLAKVMLKTAAIADMSKRSGMDEVVLIAKLNELICA